MSKAAARAQRMGGMWAGEWDQGELMARSSALFLFPEAPIAADVISVYLLAWCRASFPPEGPLPRLPVFLTESSRGVWRSIRVEWMKERTDSCFLEAVAFELHLEGQCMETWRKQRVH